MIKFKNVAISTGYMLTVLLVLTFFMTLLNYFGIIGKGIVAAFKIIIPILALFIGGFKIGKNSLRNGWLDGLILSISFIIILMLFNTLGLGNEIELRNILYYVIMTISCIFGSIIGINKKVQD